MEMTRIPLLELPKTSQSEAATGRTLWMWHESHPSALVPGFSLDLLQMGGRTSAGGQGVNGEDS